MREAAVVTAERRCGWIKNLRTIGLLRAGVKMRELGSISLHPYDEDSTARSLAVINYLTIMRTFVRACAVAFLLTSPWVFARDDARGDDEIKQQIIKDSIASYPGTCACPYNVDRAGHQCGRRSAYSRPGGYAPLCYPNDVTKEMVEDYRKRHKE
jgi:hypothetical protein